jgi:hypothetical protein
LVSPDSLLSTLSNGLFQLFWGHGTSKAGEKSFTGEAGPTEKVDRKINRTTDAAINIEMTLC